MGLHFCKGRSFLTIFGCLVVIFLSFNDFSVISSASTLSWFILIVLIPFFCFLKCHFDLKIIVNIHFWPNFSSLFVKNKVLIVKLHLFSFNIPIFLHSYKNPRLKYSIFLWILYHFWFGIDFKRAHFEISLPF